MNKPAVYLDTNIISAFWYKGEDVAAVARRFHASEWWGLERQHFSVYLSATTINELRAGSFPRQSDCLKMARGLRRLPMTRRTRLVLDELLEARLIPETTSATSRVIRAAPVPLYNTFHEVWIFSRIVAEVSGTG